MSKLVIQMLGDFSLTHDDKVINDRSKRSRKMWLLLKYLITFKDREISQAEIFELLWPQGQSENPVGALKTQLHRLRAALEELEIEDDEQIIVSSMGSYAFNTTLDYTVDATEFEQYYKLSINPNISEKEQTSYLVKAFDLYKGDFLHKNAEEKWVAPINVYYHSLYLKVAHRLIEIMFTHRHYSEMVNVARQAIQIDNNDQYLHFMLIKGLAESGEKNSAKKHYHYVIDWFYNKQRINPIPEIVAIYEALAKSDEDRAMDITAVKQHLHDLNENELDGAFFCEYEFFKYVYNLEMRDTLRNDHTVFLCLLTVSNRNNEIPEAKILTKAMKNLQEVISQSLRKSDTFARYSVSQFVLMLPNATAESCENVMNRITSKFKHENSRLPVVIDYKFGESTME